MAGKRHASNGLRQQLAAEAARIIATGDDQQQFLAAKKKAAHRLGVAETRHWPSNEEIQAALLDYQQLFQAESQPAALVALRQTALQAMHFLKPFTPQLVGTVLDGSANQHSEIQLFVYADYPEQLGLFLQEQGIPAELGERRLKTMQGSRLKQPEYRFIADQHAVALTVFGRDNQTPAVMSPVTGRPVVRASYAQLHAMLADTAAS